MADNDGDKGEGKEERSAIPNVSLSAAILAPLSALVKAQLHNSRAFLSYLLQLGYGHTPQPDANGNPVPPDPAKMMPFMLDFVSKVQINGQEELHKISVPALALVPAVPLGVESAEFEYAFVAEDYAQHNQLQPERVAVKGETVERPWYLVEHPVSLVGQIADKGSKEGSGSVDGGWSRDRSTIHIKIKVGQMAVPSGLDKLLATLTQAASVHPIPTDSDPRGSQQQ